MPKPRVRIDDLVVVIPGITGSRLVFDGDEVWGPSAGAVWRAVRTFGKSIKQLTLPPDFGDGRDERVRAVGLMPDLHVLPGVSWPVDGYSGLLDWLERRFTVRRGTAESQPIPNLIDFAYDWRLSCRTNAEELGHQVDAALGRWRASAPERAEAKVTLICHSMGGLIARYWVEALGGAEVTRKVVTLGTPHRGSMDALLLLVNGFRLGMGRASVDLSAFARSLPSLYQLAPDYACLESGGGLRYPLEFGALPGIDEAMLGDAGEFHARIRRAAGPVTRVDERYALIAGSLQPTPTTAVLNGTRLVPLVTIEGENRYGDGRVPRLSVTPFDGVRSMDTSHATVEQHGSLQNNRSVRDAVWNALTSETPSYRGGEGRYRLSVDVDDYVNYGGLCGVEVSADGDGPTDELAVIVEVCDSATGAIVAANVARNLGEARYSARLPGLGPGAYLVRVRVEGDPDGMVTGFTLVGDFDDD